MKEITKQETVTKIVYEAVDGKQFDSELSCYSYEHKLQREAIEEAAKKHEEKLGYSWPTLAWINDDVTFRAFRICDEESLTEMHAFVSLYDKAWADVVLGEYEERCEEDCTNYADYILMAVDGEIVEFKLLSTLLQEADLFKTCFTFDEDGNIL